MFDLGWHNVIATVQRHHGAGAFNPFVSEGMGVTYVVWQALNQLAVVLSWQTIIQRVLSARSEKTARQIYTRTGFYFVGRFLIPGFWGMAAVTALEANSVLTSPLHAMPTYLAMLLPVGLLGLLVAAMLAAEMSTDSSYLLTWGSVLYNDIIMPLRKQPLTEKAGLLLNRVIILCIGVFLLVYGLWYRLPVKAWDYLSITANIYLSSVSVLLVACCYWKRANSTGALFAILGGALSPIIFLLTGLEEHVEIAGLASFTLAITGMLIGSLLSTRFHKYGPVS